MTPEKCWQKWPWNLNVRSLYFTSSDPSVFGCQCLKMFECLLKIMQQQGSKPALRAQIIAESATVRGCQWDANVSQPLSLSLGGSGAELQGVPSHQHFFHCSNIGDGEDHLGKR